MNYIGTWARETRRHINAQVLKAHRHVKHRNLVWVEMVVDDLD